MAAETSDILHHQAFDNSLQANIITTSSGKIIIVNRAACKLLGYSKRELLSKNWAGIFDINESSFKKMLKQRTAEGQSRAFVTAIKKSGKPLRCEITSAVFVDKNGIENAITTIEDMSQSIQEQKNIDTKKEKIVANNIVLAKTRQKGIDIKKEKIVSDNIVLAKSRQKGIDTKKEGIVADNIVLAKSKQKKLDADKEKIVADNIVLAKSKQKGINTKKDKIVANNIILAQVKSDAQQTESTERIKNLTEKLEAEREDIVRELNENVNQLLCTSRIYVEMAKRRKENNEEYLNNSSEYTLTAIKEIGKITKELTTDIIKFLGLCQAIQSIVKDAMDVNPIKISCALESFQDHIVNVKFKLNLYRIIQEHLNNVLQHSKATEVALSLLQNKNIITLSITDNGIGFDTGKKQKGIGIENIKSQAAAYNGITDFVSQPNKGCVLTLTFPVSDALLNKN
ncbi:MAG: PAS domain-containing protein [Chitinophagaceae bacterium]